MQYQIRAAREEDAQAFLAVYGEYIHTNITFEETLPTVEEFRKRIRTTMEKYPYLAAVPEGGSEPVAYAYAGPFAQRAAYRWDVELSIYIAGAHAGHGLGKKLMETLLDILKAQGIQNAYSVVTQGNPASDHLHEAMGFTLAGMNTNTGYKNGAWHNMLYYEKAIGDHEVPPREPERDWGKYLRQGV